jgi:hypothetical protein
VTGGGQCINDRFGYDPAGGIVKECKVAAGWRPA